jgi:hypothetical protein
MCRIPVVVIASTVVTVVAAGPAFAQDERREAVALLVPAWSISTRRSATTVRDP